MSTRGDDDGNHSKILNKRESRIKVCKATDIFGISKMNIDVTTATSGMKVIEPFASGSGKLRFAHGVSKVSCDHLLWLFESNR